MNQYRGRCERWTLKKITPTQVKLNIIQESDDGLLLISGMNPIAQSNRDSYFTLFILSLKGGEPPLTPPRPPSNIKSPATHQNFPGDLRCQSRLMG